MDEISRDFDHSVEAYVFVFKLIGHSVYTEL